MTFKPDYTKKYALAVSGGVDSMCMLHMFASFAPRPDFFVVTVNHGIRAEAANDCEFVAGYCAKLGVPCKVETVDVPTYAGQNKLSEETAARILRYKVLDGIDADFVCLAHQMTDQAETVLMHIFRGSGAAGAEGMRSVNGRYVRPLLDMTRSDIEHYAFVHDVPFVNDCTNQNTDYTRNYVRRIVMPSIETVFPRVERSIARFAENIAADNDFLNDLADISDVEFVDGGAKIPITLLQQPQPIATRVLRKTFARLGIFADVEYVHVKALLALSKNNGGKKRDLSNGFVAYNDYTYITLERTNNSNSATGSGTFNDIKRDENDTESEFCVPFVTGKIQTPYGCIVVSETPIDGALTVDKNKIPSQAVVRFAKSGDMFTKFGGGTKLLRKYLIDKKIPQRKRARLPLVAIGSDVLAVCGVEISDKVRVCDNSQKMYIKFWED